MRFRETGLPGAYLVEIEPHADERGFFARTWCEREFGAQGLAARMVQASVSFNRKKGTLRGLHFQTAPRREARLVRCVAGATFNAIVDLRSRSPTYLKHFTTLLSAENHAALYVPPGFALGFQTLAPDTEVFYQMSEFHEPAAARGLRWNDPVFGIEWPDDNRTILERDATYADFDPAAVAGFASY